MLQIVRGTDLDRRRIDRKRSVQESVQESVQDLSQALD